MAFDTTHYNMFQKRFAVNSGSGTLPYPDLRLRNQKFLCLILTDFVRILLIRLSTDFARFFILPDFVKILTEIEEIANSNQTPHLVCH